ncbi:pilus assembly protein [Hydrogenophaga laconesensis]|uniref:Tfp pilus tip-associated adhesin PilY1 n=1 Tax=Hydrogenophaga laconesensis TaxID=1805971 RepID=A0ABU1V5K5_9BURK|nr:PilC/PilY family type IV pilus protein [Hydrogenophaga laconesensis]MDR7092733.1 Tfp pilus tip-associated adhesin PilY1 [Hydrogenophaga laconesensis]
MHRALLNPHLAAIASTLLSCTSLAAPLNLAQPLISPEPAMPNAAPLATSIAVSSGRLRSDEMTYVAGFSVRSWSGHLSAYRIDAVSGEVHSAPTWSANALLDAPTLDPDTRNILSHNSEGGIAFRWNELGLAQRQHLQGSGGTAEGQRRLDYLRGHDGNEIGQTGGTLRRRYSRLGSIVGANIWLVRPPDRLAYEHPGHAAFRKAYAQRPTMLYVGANDGMLHAFDALNGREMMAYVPRGIYENLWGYTQPEHPHHYLVNGQVFSGDADVSGNHAEDSTGLASQWRTLLVGGLGGGGRGYFVLDITQPLSASNATSSFRPSGVVLDRTFPSAATPPDDESRDVGHFYAPPVTALAHTARSEQIVKLNNDRWAVVMGNGVNSVNERPVLLIQYLDGPKELQRLVARPAKGQSNGLSAPRLLDVNGDGRADIAYAGDLQGHLWKFDLSHTDPRRWGVSAWAMGAEPCQESDACMPFHTARTDPPQSDPQPITAAPICMPHPLGGMQVLFGTGRNLTATDPGDIRVQTIYALWDRSTYLPGKDSAGRRTLLTSNQQRVPPGREALIRQSITGTVRSQASATDTATPYFHSSRRPVPYDRSDPNTPRGWFLDLPQARERVLTNPQLFEGQKVIVFSTAPALAPSPETGWATVLNIFTGQPAQAPVFSTADATMAMSDASRVRFGTGEFTAIHTRRGDLDLLSFQPDCTPLHAACTGKLRLTAGKDPGKRADWREIP